MTASRLFFIASLPMGTRSRNARMTPEEFLDLACKLALDHEERMVNEEQFHPILLERGLSAIEIESLTVTLAARHKIERLPFVGGSADFEISKPAFMDYVLR